MAYDPKDRMERMKELMKPIDRQILLCDDTQDLIALASILLVSSKQIMVAQLGKKGARAVIQRVLEEI